MGGDFTLAIERRGHRAVVHEYTIGVDLTHTCMFNHTIEQRDNLRTAIAERWDQHLEAEYATICTTVTEIVRGYCRDLYKQLEEEYNYLTSDKAVWENIQINDLDTETNDRKENA
jgi:hypothetical protein